MMDQPAAIFFAGGKIPGHALAVRLGVALDEKGMSFATISHCPPLLLVGALRQVVACQRGPEMAKQGIVLERLRQEGVRAAFESLRARFRIGVRRDDDDWNRRIKAAQA